MKFDKNQVIAGLTLMQVRTLLIRRSHQLYIESIKRYLKGLDLIDFSALAVLEALEKEDFIVKKSEEMWLPTQKASSLMCASFSNRLTHKKAAALMNEFLTRCQSTLRPDNPAVGIVTEVRLFGSYSRKSQHQDFGDLDIAMDCGSKFLDPQVQSDFVDEVTGAKYWEGVTTWGTTAKFLKNRNGYFSVCSFENYSKLDKTNPKKEPLLFDAAEGGRLDVEVPIPFRRLQFRRAAYRLGWCDGRNQWSDESPRCNESLELIIYQQGYADGTAAIPVPKKAKAFRLTEFNVLLLSDTPPAAAPDNIQFHQYWTLPNPTQPLYLIQASAFLNVPLKDCVKTLQAQNIPAIAAEFKQDCHQFELHAGDRRDDESFIIRAKVRGKKFQPKINQAKGTHISMVKPLMVYSKGADFISAIGREWKRYWEKRELEKGYFYDSDLTYRYSEEHKPSSLTKYLSFQQPDLILPKLVMGRSFSLSKLDKSESCLFDASFQILLYKQTGSSDTTN